MRWPSCTLIMRIRTAARFLYITCQSFVFLAFALPAARSLISGEPLAGIIGRLGVHMIGNAFVALVIAAGVECSYAFHLRREGDRRSV